MQNIIKCKTEIDQILAQLKALPDEPGASHVPLFSGSNAHIRRKAMIWEERLSDIVLPAKTEVWTTVKKIQSIRNDVDKYRLNPASFTGISPYNGNAMISDTARSLLSELGLKLLWLDQYHLELDSAKNSKNFGHR